MTKIGYFCVDLTCAFGVSFCAPLALRVARRHPVRGIPGTDIKDEGLSLPVYLANGGSAGCSQARVFSGPGSRTARGQAGPALMRYRSGDGALSRARVRAMSVGA